MHCIKKINFTIVFSLLVILVSLIDTVFAQGKTVLNDIQNACKQDVDFFRKQLEDNSAPYANNSDSHFRDWYSKGYEHVLQLIGRIGDQDDCYYVMKYYINGFDQSHISIRSYISLPAEQYPGILSAKKGDAHYIIYKHDDIDYLKDISPGDRVTHINGIDIEVFYKDYLLPFYANDKSELTLVAASIYSLIIDGNRFKPIPKTITVIHDNKPITVTLKYIDFSGDAVLAAKKLRQPGLTDDFKIEMLSNGVWIKIPSFFPAREQVIYFVGMLARLKDDIAKEDFILFDLRSNRGGSTKWSIPIIRNLWGDAYIKSLGQKHDYNRQWIKKIRISKDNFDSFSNEYSQAAIKSYISSLTKGEPFFLKKWSIFNDNDNLYSNNDDNPIKAKIYVLTDNFCRSTCWNFVKELKQIPGVIHIGQSTTIQSIYSYAKQVRAPSEYFDFFYPTQLRVQPQNNLTTALVPSYIYDKDWQDEPAIINWVLSITENFK